jgi:hypothetical protein
LLVASWWVTTLVSPYLVGGARYGNAEPFMHWLTVLWYTIRKARATDEWSIMKTSESVT